MISVNQLIVGSIICICVYVWIKLQIVKNDYSRTQSSILQEASHFGPPSGCKWEDGPYGPKAQAEQNAKLLVRNREIREYNLQIECKMKKQEKERTKRPVPMHL